MPRPLQRTLDVLPGFSSPGGRLGLIPDDHPIQLTGSVDDTAAVVTVTVNGIGYTATNNGDGTWTLADDTILAGDALPDGTYDVSVSAVDIYGNVGVDATVDELVVETVLPIVGVDALNTNDTRPQLTGTVDDVGAAGTVRRAHGSGRDGEFGQERGQRDVEVLGVLDVRDMPGPRDDVVTAIRNGGCRLGQYLGRCALVLLAADQQRRHRYFAEARSEGETFQDLAAPFVSNRVG